jgi:hypothetical protein
MGKLNRVKKISAIKAMNYPEDVAGLDSRISNHKYCQEVGNVLA